MAAQSTECVGIAAAVKMGDGCLQRFPAVTRVTTNRVKVATFLILVKI